VSYTQSQANRLAPTLCAPSPELVRQYHRGWQFPATASSAPTETSPAIAVRGAKNAQLLKKEQGAFRLRLKEFEILI